MTTVECLQVSITDTIETYKNELKREREELMKILRKTESQHVVDFINIKLASINDELDKLNAESVLESGDIIEFVS